MLVLVTGATGKVGRTLIDRMLADPGFGPTRVRALCHNRGLPGSDRVEIVRGSIADRAAVEAAVAGVSHVVHLATCKETPEVVMDVTVKGLFWLIEAFRASPDARRFVLIGGDAGEMARDIWWTSPLTWEEACRATDMPHTTPETVPRMITW